MEKFREYVTELAETCPNAPSNPAHKTLFQNRLNQWFSEYKTPDHPPYSAMIERALKELTEKNGSTEDEISQFIIKEYDALPWVHLTLLESHLERLCKSGDIVLTRGKRYMLAEENTFLTSSTKGKKKKRKRKSRWAWERVRNKQQKIRNQPKGNKGDRIEVHKGSDDISTENDVNNENKQNEGMMAVNEMEHSRDMQQELEINPSEIMNGHICGADKEEKQEEGQTNENQLTVSSPERPPGFESIIVENFSDSEIFLRTCLSSQEPSVVAGEKELDLPIDDKKLDLPREPSVHELAISENFLKLTELSEVKRSSEAHEVDVSVQEGNPKSVEVHETVPNTLVAFYRRCKNSNRPKEEAIPDIQVPRWQYGIVSTSAEESTTSKCMERQQRPWSLDSPKAVNFIGPDISPIIDDHQLPRLKLSDMEWPQDDQREESVSFPNPEQHLLHEKPQCDLLEADVFEVVQSVTIVSKPKIKVYGRRTKTMPEQSQTIQLVPMKSDLNLFEPNAIIDSQNSSMNEHEPRELLQQPPLVQGEALRDKPSHDEDASLLQPEHQPEECQKTVVKRRGRPPKISSPSLCQEMKNGNQVRLEPLKRQTRQSQHTVKADVTVGGNVKSIHSPTAEATRADDLLLLGYLVPKRRRGRPPKR